MIEQAKEATKKAREALNSAMSSQIARTGKMVLPFQVNLQSQRGVGSLEGRDRQIATEAGSVPLLPVKKPITSSLDADKNLR